jgi:hypothetical protein
MPILPRVSGVWNTLFRKDRLDRVLDDELSAAIETLSDRYVASGMDPTARGALPWPRAWRSRRHRSDEGGRARRTGGAGLDALLLDLR